MMLLESKGWRVETDQFDCSRVTPRRPICRPSLGSL